MYLTEADGIALLQHVVDRFRVRRDCRSTSTTGSSSDRRRRTACSGSPVRRCTGRSTSRPTSSSRLSGRAVADRVTFFDASTFGRASACLPVDAAAGPAAPAAAPNFPIPPLRLRAGQLTPLAACCSAMAQSSDTNGLDRLLRLRPMRVVLDVELLGVDLGEVDLDSGADREVQLAVRGGHVPRPGGVRTGGTKPLSDNKTTSGMPGAIADILRAEMKPGLLDHTFVQVCAEGRRRCRGPGRPPWSCG